MNTTPAPIIVEGLSKRFGPVQAVSNLSFHALPGRVTGFLGPNGSGKTTTLSMLLGLVRADAGRATIGGIDYRHLPRPALAVGSALSARFHPAYTGRAHLNAVCRAIGVPTARTNEVLQTVGLADAGDRKTGGYSLGMRQRLALAAALVGDPQVLMLDEPINGLDPEGIRWIRNLLRYLASEGRTVLLSSHLLSEVEQTVDDVVVIRQGTLAFTGTLDALRGGSDAERTVLAAAVDMHALATALQAHGAHVHGLRGETLRVQGLDAAQVGEVALRSGVALTHLSVESVDLERRFLSLIDGSGAQDPGPAVLQGGMQ